nr:uncharacterized protein LOC124808531 [Hydra vulgaris]
MSLTYNADLINGNILDLILTETPERINIITDKNGSLQTNRDDIANILNENFHSVFVIEDPTNFPNIALKTTKTLELDIDSIITQDIVRIKLSELNVNKALGADGVSSYVLKKCQNSFCKPLELLFKRSLQEEQTPLIWKMANSKSCTTNLLETQDILFDAIENGWCADVLYTDFSKAFDKVPHRRLMSKLISYGIVGVILNWIEAYLHNRKQRVNLGDCVSKWLTVESGVPEDEDIRINKLQLDIDNIMKWSSLWLMKFNYEKCKIMHIGFKNPCITYSMFDAETQQNNILAASKVERDLGVMMQSNLKWTSHIDKAVEERRLRGDLIFQYKIQNGYEKINWINDSTSQVQLKPYNFRSHNQKLTKSRKCLEWFTTIYYRINDN